MKPCERLLMARIDADDMLHLSRVASYRLLPATRFKGMVAMADVRKLIANSARNGAVWSGGPMVDITPDMLGTSARSMYRSLKTAPHFRITRKTILVDCDAVDNFLRRGGEGKTKTNRR